MGTPLIGDSFLALLKKSDLLPVAQVASVVDDLGLADQASAKDVARALIRAGLLTRFQAERLLEGRFRGFFIDRYKVLEILGAGGTACLYLAEDMQSGKRVALKVLSDKHKDDAGMLTRLKIEARAGAKLSHSSVIRTYGVHRTDDVFGEVHYLVMDYVEGINLEELINLTGPIPWAQAADFASQAAAGLAHSHAAGIVHRDVKPGNLLVDCRGTVKLLDFGLALLHGDETADEFSLAMIFGHSCLGTADYIAPEQSIDSYAVDSRADVYSLGCTLYVALTGKLPYPMASSTKKVEGHRSLAAPPLRESAPGVPEELVAVVDKMMAKRPEERQQSMAEVVAALAPFARRGPVEFNYPDVLAWRAKQARRRFAGRRGPGDSSKTALTSSSLLSRNSLHSASTKRLHAVAGDTAVTRFPRGEGGALSLVAPFEGARDDASLSRPEVATLASRAGPLLVPLDGGKPVLLVGTQIVVGRDPDCDVRISSGLVSGRHCELRFDGTNWRVIDLGSKNGTQVNGLAVSDQILNPGDRLSIARQHHYRVDHSAYSAPKVGRFVAWGLAGLVALALSLTGFFLWRVWQG